MLLIKNGCIKPMVGADIENGCVHIGNNGKDGAVVIRTADPLTTLGGEARVTMVDGKIVYRA